MNLRCNEAIRRSEMSQTNTARNLLNSVALPLLQSQTTTNGRRSEVFEFGNVDGDFALEIAHGNIQSCHSERIEESQIVSAEQSQTIIREVSRGST